MSKFRNFLKKTYLSSLFAFLGASALSAAPVFLDTDTGKHAADLIDRNDPITPVSFPMAGHHSLDFDPLGAIMRMDDLHREIARVEYWRSNGTILKSAILQAKDGKITSTLAGVRWRQLPMPEIEKRLSERPAQSNEGFIEPVLRYNGDIRHVDDVPGLFQGYFTEPAIIRCANGRTFKVTEVSAIQPLLIDPLQPENVRLHVGSQTESIDSFKSGVFWHQSPIKAVSAYPDIAAETAHTGHEVAELNWGDLGSASGNEPAATSAYWYPVRNDSCDDDPLYFISEEDLPDYRQAFPLGKGRSKPFSPFGGGVSSVPLPHGSALLLTALVGMSFVKRQRRKTS